ncbi:hypothetical protein BN2476_210063 [Paraburkholderia piptadeniae]|uniref:Uncharacterized protein n=1 Tax=Paraburkholderia piptadeniae TaxID=1701573 RepID=A0A1N7RVM1_9BURK|nr:hypothetical protein BN2476_210063 [Paraburkholderia piptadeniae]
MPRNHTDGTADEIRNAAEDRNGDGQLGGGGLMSLRKLRLRTPCLRGSAAGIKGIFRRMADSVDRRSASWSDDPLKSRLQNIDPGYRSSDATVGHAHRP